MSERLLARDGRVAVRRFRRSDLRERMAWPAYTDPFHVHLNFDLSSFIEREKWLFARTMNAGRMYFAVEDEGGRFIGEMSLRDIDTSAKSARLGIHLASNMVSHGYGTEALRALLQHYFCGMEWEVMFLDVAAYNYRAIRLYERLHFEHLAPFWRRIAVDESVLTDPQFSEIRRFLRRTPQGLECLHYDMALTREKYVQTRGEKGEVTGRAAPGGLETQA